MVIVTGFLYNYRTRNLSKEGWNDRHIASFIINQQAKAHTQQVTGACTQTPQTWIFLLKGTYQKQTLN